MENLKKILIFALGIVMAFGLTPAFAASPSGTNGVTVGVSPSVSIDVIDSAAFGSLAADNIASNAQPITINSTSNEPINVGVSAATWTSNDTGNMPLSALQWSNPVTDTQGTVVGAPMTTSLAPAINRMSAPTPTTNSSQIMNLNMQVPFGSSSGSYNTTVTWTAQAA
jgi:hypothetical protein